MLSARTAEGSVPKIFGSCDAIATLESTRTSNALRTKGRSSTCVYNICESICANAGLKAYAIHGVTGRRSMKRKKIERLEGGSPPAYPPSANSSQETLPRSGLSERSTSSPQTDGSRILQSAED